MASTLHMRKTITLMSPNKGKTAVHGCHLTGDMNMRMRKVLAIPRSCYVCILVSRATWLNLQPTSGQETTNSGDKNGTCASVLKLVLF